MELVRTGRFWCGLSPDDEELITAVAALVVGIGIGGTIAAWIYQGRKRLNS